MPSASNFKITAGGSVNISKAGVVMENFLELKKYLDGLNESERESARLDFESFKSQLPPGARSMSVSPDSFISEVVAGCNIELAKVAFETTRNVSRYLEVSKKKHLQIYPYLNQRNYRFHASATFLNERQGVIALNAGVFYAISDICSTVVHKPEFLSDFLPDSTEVTSCQCPHCGGPRTCEGWLKDYSWLPAKRADIAPVWNPMITSLTPTPRSAIGGYLILRCLYWICAHEIGHLLLEHLNILDKLSYSEDEKGIGEQERLQRHVMEIEADTFATCIDINIPDVKENLNRRLERAKSKSTYQGPWPEASEHLAARLLALVPFIIGIVLSHINNHSTDTHPLPKHRFSYISKMFEDVLKIRNQSEWVTEHSHLYDDFLVIAAVGVNDEKLLREWFNADDKEDFHRLVEGVNSFEKAHGTWEDRLHREGLFERYQG